MAHWERFVKTLHRHHSIDVDELDPVDVGESLVEFVSVNYCIDKPDDLPAFAELADKFERCFYVYDDPCVYCKTPCERCGTSEAEPEEIRAPDSLRRLAYLATQIRISSMRWPVSGEDRILFRQLLDQLRRYAD